MRAICRGSLCGSVGGDVRMLGEPGPNRRRAARTRAASGGTSGAVNTAEGAAERFARERLAPGATGPENVLVDIGGPIGGYRCFHSPFSLSPVGWSVGWAVTVPSSRHHQPRCPGTGCGVGSVGGRYRSFTSAGVSIRRNPTPSACPPIPPRRGDRRVSGASWGPILNWGDTPRWANGTFPRKTVGAS